MLSATFLLALGAVAVIGFANQRGGTCTVAAMEEIVTEGRFGQMTALIEASIWVGGGLLLLSALGRSPLMPTGYVASVATIVGGVLFGVGAFVNRACAFGTLARLGSGEWAYLATPVGFYLGALAARDLPPPGLLTETSVLLGTPVWFGIFVMALLLARSFAHGWQIRRNRHRTLSGTWAPHVATTVIGTAFLVAFVVAGPWSYTEYLSDLAHGTRRALPPVLALNIVLLGGAVLGGWTAHRLGFVHPDGKALARCLIGGAIMGAGSTLIPGGNTRLILLGMPLLQAYAWLAFASMCATLYTLIRFTQS